jgi:hypothetical protein
MKSLNKSAKVVLASKIIILIGDARVVKHDALWRQLDFKKSSAFSSSCVQEEPLDVGRGASFLSRHFRSLGHQGVAAFL